MTHNPSDNLPHNVSHTTHPLGLSSSESNQPGGSAPHIHPAIIQRSSNTSGDDTNSKLVDQTKSQIRTLVQEIAELAKSDCSVEDFYEGFLTRTTSALASIGGAIWVRETIEDPLKLHYHINLKQTNLAADKKAQHKHSQLIKKLADQGEPALIGPDSGTQGDDGESAGNPTEYLLVVGPLKIDNQTIGIVEIFQRPGAGPTTQRGYLRFVMQMTDIASDFLRNQRIRSFAKQQKMWQQLEQFMRLVHRGLDTEQTVFTLANEGRRLIDCDRVSVAIGQGRHCRVKAVSGLDSIERRSDQVKKLSSLAATVIRAGQPIWYTGDEELPPQIEKKVHAYVDKSHTRMLSILPLFQTRADGEEQANQRKKPVPLGAVIIEQLKDSRVTPSLKNRAKIVVEHGETALTNAEEHNSIFLMPLWKTLGKATAAFNGNNRGKTLLALVTIAGAIAFLSLFPYSFGLGAKGSLIPETQFEVFAKTNGTIEELANFNDGNTLVQKDQILARMKNSDIELAISDISGRIASAQIDIADAQRAQTRPRRDSPLTNVEHAEIASKLDQATQLKDSLLRELEIRIEEQSLLDITSPSLGRVINWNVRQSLMHRPVLEGQKLLTIVHPDTEWLIELEMPERRMKHLIEAERKNDEPLVVTFGLLSNPGTEYTGELVQIDKKLDVYSDEGNTALVRVKFPNDLIDQELLRSETRVFAKVQCGTRSIGYVIFHELIETVQSSVMLWF